MKRLSRSGQYDGQGDHRTPRAYVREAFRKYLECGIFAHDFARVRCADCGHNYFVAFSCKGRVQVQPELADPVLPKR